MRALVNALMRFDKLGGDLRPAADGTVRATLSGGVPDSIDAVFREHGALLGLVAECRTSRATPSIAMAPCTVCAELFRVTVTAGLLRKDERPKRGGSWPRCRMTPDCPGCHQPLPKDLVLARSRTRARKPTSNPDQLSLWVDP